MKRLVPAVLCLLLLLCAVSCGKATTAPPSFSGGPSEAGSSEGSGNTSKEASPSSSPYSPPSLPSEAPVLLETDARDSRKLLLSVTLPEDAGREISLRLYKKGLSADDPEAIVDLCQIALDEEGKGNASLFRADSAEDLMLLIVSPSASYELPLLKGGTES